MQTSYNPPVKLKKYCSGTTTCDIYHIPLFYKYMTENITHISLIYSIDEIWQYDKKRHCRKNRSFFIWLCSPYRQVKSL